MHDTLYVQSVERVITTGEFTFSHGLQKTYDSYTCQLHAYATYIPISSLAGMWVKTVMQFYKSNATSAIIASYKAYNIITLHYK